MNLISKIIATTIETAIDVVELSTCIVVDTFTILPDLTEDEVMHRTKTKIKEMKDE